MTVLIIEDEDLAVRKLRRLVAEIDPKLSVLGVTGSIEESIQWLQTNTPPDLILMDIELADGQSFEIFEQIDVRSRVIFTTSYDEYALRAFRVNSIDYLLKPIQKEDLQRSLTKMRTLPVLPGPEILGRESVEPLFDIEKLLRGLQQQGRPTGQEYRKRFLVKLGQRLLSVDVSEILYFFTDDRFSFFMTRPNQRFLVDYTLDELVALLDPNHFFRVNRSLLLTHAAVDQIQPYFGNRLALLLRPTYNREAIVSREKVSEFKRWMGN